MRRFLLFLAVAFCSFSITDLFAQQNYYRNVEGQWFTQSEYEEYIAQQDQLAEKGKGLTHLSTKRILRQGADSTILLFGSMVTNANPTKAKNGLEAQLSLIGKPFPFERLSNNAFSKTDLAGKPTLINFWFTGCGMCIMEFPGLNELKTRYNDQVNFLAITLNKTDQVEKLFRKRGTLDFLHLNDERNFVVKDLGFEAFPVNMFLDAQGNIISILGNLPVTLDEGGNIVMDEEDTSFAEAINSLL